MTKRVAFYTLGCKLNYAETEALARMFSPEKYTTVDFKSVADIYVINTCSVTQQANQKCKDIIKRAHKAAPEAQIAVVGCFAQLKAEEIAQIEGVQLVLGTKEKFELVKRLEGGALPNAEKVYSCDIDEVEDFTSSYSLEGRTRSFLKVQDGCDYNCSYCTIPLARGKSRNPKIEQIVAQAQEIAQRGINEIILTGVNIGDFGRTTGESFFDLVKALDLQVAIPRIRISSIEPNLLTDQIIEYVAQSQRFMPHFHIPLQSGSDSVLKLMRRRYMTKLFEQRIQKIKTVMPHAAIGIDVIVGSPGETEAYFQESYSFLESLPFTYLHVFTYSERENTDALSIEPKVLEKEKKRRSALLLALSEQKRTAFYQSFAGTEAAVLFESKKQDGKMFGFTQQYIKVSALYQSELVNKIVPVQLLPLTEDEAMPCIPH